MVFKEIKHTVAYAVDTLPTVSQCCRRMIVALHRTQTVVEVYFVIKVVELTTEKEIPVKVDVVDFGYKQQVGESCLDLWYRPFPKFQRHHKHHVASECINPFGRPIPQYVQHFKPGRGDRGEMAAAIAVVNTIVEFYGLIPVVAGWECIETVVA